MTMQRALAPPVVLLIRASALALVVMLCFLGLGNGSLWDNSEPTYGEVVKEMFRTGDWVSMHYKYAAWYLHPP